MFYDDDADLTLLDGKTVAIIGFGSQGHAHALNLKESGVDVVVGLRPDSASVDQAREAGLEVTDLTDAASRGDLVMVLLPDEKHGEVYRDQIADGIAPGNMLLFGHGFSIHYGEVEPPADVDVALVAPKGPGHLVRRQYTEGSGVPGLIAVHQDPSGNAQALALAAWSGPDDNPWSVLPMRAMVERGAIEPPDPSAPGPFAWGEEGLIAQYLEAAGFTEHHVEPLDFTIDYRSAADWWQSQCEFSVWFASTVARASDDDLAEVSDAIDRHAERFAAGDGTLRIPARTWVGWAAA